MTDNPWPLLEKIEDIYCSFLKKRENFLKKREKSFAELDEKKDNDSYKKKIIKINTENPFYNPMYRFIPFENNPDLDMMERNFEELAIRAGLIK
ncbi:hypothetical protein JW949_03705 [Candidatus Woesearchaeota archaeon]|nr:hypothetical protein [Candidatus Woesearchaeota archaeon]